MLFIDIGALIVAFQSDSSAFVSLLSYTQIVYAFLIDIFVFKQTISGFQLASAILIFATTVGFAVYKYK